MTYNKASNSTSQKFDVCILGSGIIGLSTAYNLKLARPDLNILLLEKEAAPAMHQTGRNSGVIHSGIYYRPGSLKATFCKMGLNETYEFCKEHKIPHKRTGKLIVAKNKKEIQGLNNLQFRGQQNGLKCTESLSAEEMKKLEPYCSGVQGLYVQETGIVDYVKMSEVLKSLFEKSEGRCIYSARAKHIDSNANIVTYEKENSIFKVHCKVILNCTGIHADSFTHHSNLKILPFRGEYFSLKPSKTFLVKALIYPVPDSRFPFLGVHFTRSVYDHVHVGPNAVLALAKEGYKKSDFELSSLRYLLSRQLLGLVVRYPKYGLKEQLRSLSSHLFLHSARELIPDLQLTDLEPDVPGIRAQAVENWGNIVDDFRIVTDDKVMHVLNAPSPAATSCLPIGRHISEQAIKLL